MTLCFCRRPIPATNGEGRPYCSRCGDYLDASHPATTGVVPDADPLLAEVRAWAEGRPVTEVEVQRRWRVTWLRARRLIDAMKGDQNG